MHRVYVRSHTYSSDSPDKSYTAQPEVIPVIQVKCRLVLDSKKHTLRTAQTTKQVQTKNAKMILSLAMHTTSSLQRWSRTPRAI